MKLLILTGNYPIKNASNNGIFIHQQVKALQQLGVACHVLLLYNWYPPFGLHRLHTYWQAGYDLQTNFYKEFDGVKIHAVPMFVKMPSRVFKENTYDRAAKAIIKYVDNNSDLKNADWMYAHFLTDNSYIAAKIKDRLHIKLAAIARGDDVHAWPVQNPELQKNFPLVFEKADLLLANSRNLGNDTKKWMESGKVRSVEVVYNGIDYKRFRPAETMEEKLSLKEKYRLDPKKKYMVCIATPVALKGWMELLQAIKNLGEKFEGWKLLMIAPPRDCSDAIDLPKTGDELSIADKLHYIPGLTPSEIMEILRACDAFVLPSYNEGMANALLEAMASGLPCIATDVGGHSEVIENGKQGILIAPRSVSGLVTAIQQVVENEDLRKIMGREARERMIIFGDYFYNATKLLSLLNSH